ncbi:hypothetical protein FGIG_10196 [Fasciola gigantica]|uniref:THUMP domain-containing protein n=1 Tax=Fasciola gigantica TaxID=46835 RepID=A0A504YUC7_FASGI|nr:hypothetical protein FGIG_10196 [Fasciola gigantica]
MHYSFYATKSGVSNCLFILHYARSCPNALVNSIFEHMLQTRVVESRHVLRVLPVAATCHASAAELARCFRILWSAFLGQEKSVNTKEQNRKESKDETVNSDSNFVDACEGPEDEKKKTISSNCVHSACPPVELPHARPNTLHGPKTFLVAFKARNYDRLSRDTAIETVVSTVREIDASWRICPTTPSVTVFVNVLRNVACISLLEDFDRFRKYNLAELISPVSNTSAPLVNTSTKVE